MPSLWLAAGEEDAPPLSGQTSVLWSAPLWGSGVWTLPIR